MPDLTRTNVYRLSSVRTLHNAGLRAIPLSRFELAIHEQQAAKQRGGPPPNPRIIAIIPLAGGEES